MGAKTRLIKTVVRQSARAVVIIFQYNNINEYDDFGDNLIMLSVWRLFFFPSVQDAASHSNLGAILHINNKLDEAERSYKNALRLQPDDATTLANLRKLRDVLHRRTVK